MEIYNRLLYNHTVQGELVMDCFAGSGTCTVAALIAGRNVVAIEPEQRQIDGIAARIDDVQQLMQIMGADGKLVEVTATTLDGGQRAGALIDQLSKQVHKDKASLARAEQLKAKEQRQAEQEAKKKKKEEEAEAARKKKEADERKKEKQRLQDEQIKQTEAIKRKAEELASKPAKKPKLVTKKTTTKAPISPSKPTAAVPVTPPEPTPTETGAAAAARRAEPPKTTSTAAKPKPSTAQAPQIPPAKATAKTPAPVHKAPPTTKSVSTKPTATTPVSTAVETSPKKGQSNITHKSIDTSTPAAVGKRKRTETPTIGEPQEPKQKKAKGKGKTRGRPKQRPAPSGIFAQAPIEEEEGDEISHDEATDDSGQESEFDEGNWDFYRRGKLLAPSFINVHKQERAMAVYGRLLGDQAAKEQGEAELHAAPFTPQEAEV